jgi:hypothetical protein
MLKYSNSFTVIKRELISLRVLYILNKSLPSSLTLLFILPPAAVAVVVVGRGVDTSLKAGWKGEGGRAKDSEAAVSLRRTKAGGGGCGRPVAAGTGA